MERIPARLAAMLATVAAAGAQAALAQAVPPPPVATIAAPAPAPADTTAETAADTALLLGLSQNRMTVPVSIDTRGPWQFVIDTGAERTVVSRQLANRLGLAAGPPLRVVAMTGPTMVGSVIVPMLGVSTLPQPTITAPALEAVNIGAAGILGIDTLQGHRVEIDFDQSAMRLRPSRRHYVAAVNHGDEIVVVARSRFGQLIVTDAHWRGKRISVIIDTGSNMTIGNPALQQLMAPHAQRLGVTSALSVTGGTLDAEAFLVDDLKIGGVGIDHVPIAFADAAPFHRFLLDKTPALMLGMDTLRMFRRVRIDFANRAIEFSLPHTDDVRVGSAPAV